MDPSPYQSPVSPDKPFSTTDFADSLQWVRPIYDRRLWFRIVGIGAIAIGILYTISIFGAIFGIPLILAGVFMMQSMSRLEACFRGQPHELMAFSEKLSSSMLIAGILMLVILSITVLYFLFILSMVGLGMFGALNNM